MDKEMLEQFQLIMQGMADMEKRLKQRFEQKIQESEARVKKEVIHETQILIENQVSKRIDSLFDGYKLTHEKQWELERETEALKAKTDELQARIAALESKIA